MISEIKVDNKVYSPDCRGISGPSLCYAIILDLIDPDIKDIKKVRVFVPKPYHSLHRGRFSKWPPLWEYKYQIVSEIGGTKMLTGPYFCQMFCSRDTGQNRSRVNEFLKPLYRVTNKNAPINKIGVKLFRLLML